MSKTQPPVSWHNQELPVLLADFETKPQGLEQDDAAARLLRYGPNRLPERPPRPWWNILLSQFRSPLIYILVLAAGVSLLIGDIKDAGFIVLVLAINATIGCYQEWRAEQSCHALRKFLQIRSAVLRDGEVVEINAQEIVPGDVVWLESGNRVPADVRLMSATGLEIDESLLTGESLAAPVSFERWGVLLLLSLSILPASELHKWWMFTRRGRR